MKNVLILFAFISGLYCSKLGGTDEQATRSEENAYFAPLIEDTAYTDAELIRRIQEANPNWTAGECEDYLFKVKF